MPYPSCPDRIRAAISRSRLSQPTIAQRIGVHDSAVYRWTTGDRTPTHAHLSALAEMLGIPMRDLQHR